MISDELLNYGLALKVALQKQMIPNVQLYRTGNMRSSVEVVVVDDNCLDVVIATNYASFTNTRGRLAGWVQRVVDNMSRCYSENVQNDLTSGFDLTGEDVWKPKD